MTVPVSATQFSELAAFVPLPTARLRLPDGDLTDLRKTWKAAVITFARDLDAWRRGFLDHLALLRATLERSVEEIGPEATGKLAVEGASAARDAIEEMIALTRGRLDESDVLQRKLNQAALVSPGLTRAMRKDFRNGMLRQTEMLREASDRLLALELDFDPDAHRGATFEDAEALIAHLHA